MSEVREMNGSEPLPQRKHPFGPMKVDRKILDTMEKRENCMKCKKSRKFYCYSCFLPLPSLSGKLPQVKLPLKIDIIKHRQEIDGKSSAGHAAILAPDDVRVFTYPNIPDYSQEPGVVLIFPSSTAVSIHSLFNGKSEYEVTENFGLPYGHHMGTLLTKKQKVAAVDEDQPKLDNKKVYSLENLPIKRAVFIDSTWHQCRSIYKDPKVNSIKTVVLQNRISQFWRHQKNCPRWYLATIEAIHQFLLEVHTSAWGLNINYRGLDNLEVNLSNLLPNKLIDCKEEPNNLVASYAGQYDNLLFFFIHMYDLIHDRYDHDALLAYKRPLI